MGQIIRQKGFSLVEIIVVTSVFMLVVGVAISIFISIYSQQRRVLAEQELLNQMSYVQEHIAKALRSAKIATTTYDVNCLGQAGYIYLLTHYDSASDVYKGIKFLNQLETDVLGNPTCQEFFLDETSDPGNPVLKEIKSGGPPVALTLISLQIGPDNPVRFALNGTDGTAAGMGCLGAINQCAASNTDSLQPRVVLLLNVKISGVDDYPTKTIQTTVSQRGLNIK